MERSAGEMPFLDHLEELRLRILRSLGALVVTFGIGFWLVQRFGMVEFLKGPIAPYLPDGRLDFLGRADDQVKIRGSRVEIGEVETLLGQHPAVRTCAVSAWEFSGEKRLIAYVIFNQKGAVTTSELRSFLAAKAPEYMIPYAFVTLEELPLLPNKPANQSNCRLKPQAAG